MEQVEREQTAAELVFRDPDFHFAGEFEQAAPARGERQFMMRLAKHGVGGQG